MNLQKRGAQSFETNTLKKNHAPMVMNLATLGKKLPTTLESINCNNQINNVVINIFIVLH